MTRRVLAAGFAVLALSAACKNRTERAKEDVRARTGCVIDWAAELALEWEHPDGCELDDLQCRDACFAGDAPSCVERGYRVQQVKGRDEEATLLFLRGCEYGHASGCTNYAAALWASSEVDQVRECARRIFDATCKARDPFGCGMLGRMMLEAAEEPGEIALGRRVLEDGCKDLGGFACRALALHLESGKLGPADPKRVKELLARACDTGDEDACDHDKADETFTPAD